MAIIKRKAISNGSQINIEVGICNDCAKKIKKPKSLSSPKKQKKSRHSPQLA